jgi:hypothetical protein
MGQSRYLAGLDAEQRAKLEHKLLARQSGRCFICDDPIDLVLHKGQLDIDHIDPLIEEGLDSENNFRAYPFVMQPQQGCRQPRNSTLACCPSHRTDGLNRQGHIGDRGRNSKWRTRSGRPDSDRELPHVEIHKPGI